jgi:hypothetical protein
VSLLRFLSWLLLGAAWAVWALVVVGVAVWPRDNPTGVRLLEWRGVSGQPLASAPDGCGRDTRFPLLMDEERIWVPCVAEPDLPGGALALLQPAAGKARLLAPLPERLALQRVEGLLPGPEGLVGIVYRASTSAPAVGGVFEVLVAAVVDEDGWREPPQRLPGGAGSRLLGMGWRGEQLEVALAPARGEDTRAEAADAVRVRLGDMELPLTVTREEMCLHREHCIVRAAWLAEPWRGWRFLVEDGEALREVGESGGGEVEGHPVQWLSGLDLRVAGRLRPAYAPATHRLEPDGSILPAEPLPMELRPLPASAVAEERQLSPVSRSRWEQSPGVFHDWQGERWHTVASAEGLLRVSRDSGGSAAVARLEARCAGLPEGYLLPARRGLTLLTPDGCYVGLTRSGRRADPLGLLEHLHYTREPRAGHALLWLLLGLPVLLVPVGVLGWPRTVARRRLAGMLCAACYLGSAVPLLRWLLPLLSW